MIRDWGLVPLPIAARPADFPPDCGMGGGGWGPEAVFHCRWWPLLPLHRCRSCPRVVCVELGCFDATRATRLLVFPTELLADTCLPPPPMKLSGRPGGWSLPGSDPLGRQPLLAQLPAGYAAAPAHGSLSVDAERLITR